MSKGKGEQDRKDWNFDFTEINQKRSRGAKSEESSPPGYVSAPLKTDDSEDTGHNLVAKLGWSLALGPWKQLPLNAFIMWMAGNTISLFPIMMVVMMLIRPFQSIFSYKDVFQKLRGDQALFQKMVYLLGNVMAVGLGLYKVNSMGLLPTAQSDWLEFMDDREYLEISHGGLSMS